MCVCVDVGCGELWDERVWCSSLALTEAEAEVRDSREAGADL